MNKKNQEKIQVKLSISPENLNQRMSLSFSLNHCPVEKQVANASNPLLSSGLLILAF